MSTSSSPCFINMTFSTIHNPNASCVPHTGRECAPQPVTVSFLFFMFLYVFGACNRKINVESGTTELSIRYTSSTKDASSRKSCGKTFFFCLLNIKNLFVNLINLTAFTSISCSDGTNAHFQFYWFKR